MWGHKAELGIVDPHIRGGGHKVIIEPLNVGALIRQNYSGSNPQTWGPKKCPEINFKTQKPKCPDYTGCPDPQFRVPRSTIQGTSGCPDPQFRVPRSTIQGAQIHNSGCPDPQFRVPRSTIQGAQIHNSECMIIPNSKLNCTLRP